MSDFVPIGWHTKKISDIADVYSGGTPDRTNPSFYAGRNPWVKSGEVNSRLIRHTEEHISDEAILQSSAKWVPSGAVLVAMYGATAGKVAKLMIDATLNQAISAVLVKDEGSHSDYLFHSLDFNSEELLKSLQGSGQPNLSGGLIKSLKILYPPLPEQQKIAAILTSVDDVIESTQAQINKLKDLKTGMMQELLTKGIGHSEFKDSAVGRIPREWEVFKVGDLVDVIDPQPDHRTPPEVLDGVPYIGLGDIDKDGLINFSSARKVSREAFEKQVSSFNIHDGAFIFGKIGTIGNPSILPKERFYCLSANIVLLTAADKLIMQFIFHLFKSGIVNEQVQMQTNTTSQPALGIKKVREFEIPVPSNRNEIAELVVSFEAVDLKVSNCNLKLNKYLEAKKALMQDLLTGKVRVKVE